MSDARPQLEQTTTPDLHASFAEHTGINIIDAFKTVNWTELAHKAASLSLPNLLIGNFAAADGNQAPPNPVKEAQGLADKVLGAVTELLKEETRFLAGDKPIDGKQLEEILARARKFTPEKTPSKEEIAKLVSKLGDDEFEVREQASRDLEKVGVPALPQLVKAAKESGDAEIRRRAGDLVNGLLGGHFHSYAELRQFSTTGDGFSTWVSTDLLKGNLKAQMTALDEYASDPKKVEKRIFEIATMLDMNKDGKLGLSDDAKEHLTRDLVVLANIKSESAKAHLEYAGVRGADGKDPAWQAEVRANLLKAIAQDPKIVGDEMFFDVVHMYKLNGDAKFMSAFDSKSKFMEEYKKAGGSEDKLKQQIKTSEERSNRPRAEWDSRFDGAFPDF